MGSTDGWEAQVWFSTNRGSPEWQSARGGGNQSGGYTYSGSNTVGDVVWYWDNSSNGTHPMKTKAANELGLYDMSGNVWEWCWDWYGSYKVRV